MDNRRDQKVELKWLAETPVYRSGVTWGVPWNKGNLNREEPICLQTADGVQMPVQSWPMAYWPDGSVKWTGHAAVMEKNSGDRLWLEKGKESIPEDKVEIKETDEEIKVDTGLLECVLSKSGEEVIRSLTVNQSRIGTAGRLLIIKEKKETDGRVTTIIQEQLRGRINKAIIEQTGPVRAVVRIEGEHINEEQKLFPFVIRFYFYAGTSEIKIIHTFIYNGNPAVDQIKGIGLELSAEFIGEPWNRHVSIAADTGIFTEPSRLLLSRRHKDTNGLFSRQVSGKPVDLTNEEAVEKSAKGNAVWNDFKIIQDSADHYLITKRTEQGCAWLEALHGKRAKGMIYAGGENGGLAMGMKNFWQKYPASLEVNDLAANQSKITAWFWSPDAPAMDLRHYSKNTHVPSAYEGFEEMRATPEGIANTSELTINCFTSFPGKESLEQITRALQNPPLLVCKPHHYYETKAAGIWSLPDVTDSFKSFLETQLDKALSFYKNEIEQRKWYGYWNYGDIMHTYDPVRHQWCYDLGGFAWQNTELVPNIWLWHAFFRSGRADIFKMAEAMTRHTSEVDQYHSGEYKGLGSRHNVSHWGCGCKEARVSMAGLHKYYYFLTADERVRDLLEDVRDADYAAVHLDPMREFCEPDQFPTHVRTGPDWAAFCSNWLSEWERTENTVYKNKILTGINDLKQLPYRLLSGPIFGYDPTTSHLHHMGDGLPGGYHMVIAFGAPQIWMELDQMLGDEEWKDMLAEFGAFYASNDREKQEKSEGLLSDKLFHWPMFASAMMAYAAARKNDSDLAERAWRFLLEEQFSHLSLPIEEEEITVHQEIKEIPWITTNTISQWCLNMMAVLELISDMPPDQALQKSVNEQKSM